jgi:predicted GH43/DUF377 family glycosyl hydrolase
LSDPAKNDAEHTRYHGQDSLFLRHPSNPILSGKDWPYPVNSVFNAGVVRLDDGDTLLLCRVEDRRGLSHLCAARSANGIDGWRIDSQPTLAPNPREYPEEIWGIEDPRITYVPELKQYAVAYTSFARGGPCVSLAMTRDFKTFERYGVIMTPEDKDASLLPRRIGGLWALVHRPTTSLGAHMWISYSPDLKHWGGHRVILEARRGGWWDANKIGLCSPFIETEKGWLAIYHGVRQTAAGSIYRLGLALFDLKKPATRRLLDVRSGGRIRAERRCPRGGLSLRADHRGRRRHHQSLLRGRRLLHRVGYWQHSHSLFLARPQRKLGRRPTCAIAAQISSSRDLTVGGWRALDGGRVKMKNLGGPPAAERTAAA